MLTTLHLDWRLYLKRISYFNQKIRASHKIHALTDPAVPRPLLSYAPGHTGLLPSVSLLLLPRPAAFLSLPSCRSGGIGDEGRYWEKNYTVALPLRAPVLYTNVCKVHRDGMHHCLVLPLQHMLYKKSEAVVSGLNLFTLCSHLSLWFIFRCLSHNHRMVEVGRDLWRSLTPCSSRVS